MPTTNSEMFLFMTSKCDIQYTMATQYAQVTDNDIIPSAVGSQLKVAEAELGSERSLNRREQ